jgi:hypothetical protein
VLQVLTENACIKGVETNIGTVFCEYFVNSAGMVKKWWSVGPTVEHIFFFIFIPNQIWKQNTFNSYKSLS